MASFQRRRVVGGFHTRAIIRRAGHSWSKTFKRKADAVAWARSFESDLDAGILPGTGHYLLSDMVDRYSATVLAGQVTGKKTAAKLAAWLVLLGDRPLAGITARDLAAARDELAGRMAPSTVRRYLSALSAAMNRAVKDWQWIGTNPCRSIIWPVEPRGRVRYLDPDELISLRRACQARSVHLADLVELALMTGMRRGELLGLTWGAVDWAHKRVLLLRTKNNERRQVPLTQKGMEIMRRRCPRAWTKSMYIFCSRGQPGASVDLRRVWYAALRDAGITGFRFHDLRHTAASYLAMTGATPNQIAEILGHKTLAMVKRYAHLSVENQAIALERLASRLDNPGE